MRRTIGRWLLRFGQDLGSQLRRQFLRWLSGVKRRQAHQSFLTKAPLPQRDCRCSCIQLLFDVVIAGSFVEHQDDPHSHRHADRKIAPSQMPLQFASLSASQAKLRSQRHNHMTLSDLVKSTYRQPTSIDPVESEVNELQSCKKGIGKELSLPAWVYPKEIMQYQQLGNTGVFVSRLCLGAMTFGGGTTSIWSAIGALGQQDTDTLIGQSLDAGINFIDTANVYGGGESEIQVGRALGARRNDVVLA